MERWQITSLTETSVQRNLCKNGQPTSLNSVSLGESATSLQFWICTQTRSSHTIFRRFSSLNGLIFHSDQGWQYQHAYFRNTIEKCGIIQSMSRKGNCYDNSIMETFFGRLKNEMFYGCEKDYKSYEEFSSAMAKYIDYYNNERIQAKTKWMPPVKYRMASMG